jgi:hypothetical protein
VRALRAVLLAAALLCAAGSELAAAECSGFPEVTFKVETSAASNPAAAALNGVWIGDWKFKDDVSVCAKLYVSVPDQRGIHAGEAEVVYCFAGMPNSHTSPGCSDKFSIKLSGRTLSWNRFVDDGKMSFTLNPSGSLDGINGSNNPKFPDVTGTFHREKP